MKNGTPHRLGEFSLESGTQNVPDLFFVNDQGCSRTFAA
jgi:hypothetical protein